MGPAGGHRVHQRQHLAPRRRATHAAVEAHRGVDQGFDAEAFDQRGGQQQARVRNEIVVVEGRVNPVEGLRYSAH